MSAKRLKEIEERANAATPGPWVVDSRGGGVVRGGALVHKARGSGQPQLFLAMSHEDEPIEGQMRNAAFVAASRQDVTYLLEQLKWARELLCDVLRNQDSMMLPTDIRVFLDGDDK